MREKIEHPRIRYDALSDEPIPFLELEDELHDRLRHMKENNRPDGLGK